MSEQSPADLVGSGVLIVAYIALKLCGVLGVVFVALKLLSVIHWSWWWVTLPFWSGFLLVLLVLTTIGIWIVLHALHKSFPRPPWKKHK